MSTTKKNANGQGSLRKRENGTWEARFTVCGKRKSIYASTKNEARKKMTAIIAANDIGEYCEETSLTVEQWLNIWKRDYWIGLKQSTKRRYEDDIRLHIIPMIGKKKLSRLTSIEVQQMCNSMLEKGFAAKTISMVHGTLHVAIEKAVKLDYLKKNVCDYCDLPKVNRVEMHTLTDDKLPLFLRASQSDIYEALFFTAIFTGMRESELIGLTWDCIDFGRGTIRIYRQLQKERKAGGEYHFSTPKNGKERTIQPALQVLEKLKQVKVQQTEYRLQCASTWQNK